MLRSGVGTNTGRSAQVTTFRRSDVTGVGGGGQLSCNGGSNTEVNMNRRLAGRVRDRRAYKRFEKEERKKYSKN